MFESSEFSNQKIAGPPMTQDDGFNSHPKTGKIAYRTPALWDLFGMPEENFDNYLTMTFYVSVMAHHDLLEHPLEISCQVKSNCKIVYRLHYSPAIHWISPRVIYNTAKVELWFDPRSTPGII
jgi:hypothetical protein